MVVIHIDLLHLIQTADHPRGHLVVVIHIGLPHLCQKTTSHHPHHPKQGLRMVRATPPPLIIQDPPMARRVHTDHQVSLRTVGLGLLEGLDLLDGPGLLLEGLSLDLLPVDHRRITGLVQNSWIQIHIDLLLLLMADYLDLLRQVREVDVRLR